MMDMMQKHNINEIENTSKTHQRSTFKVNQTTIKVNSEFTLWRISTIKECGTMKRVMLILLVLSVSVMAQGKIYSNIEASKLYGAKLKTVKISAEDLLKHVDKSDGVLKFRITDRNELLIIPGYSKTLEIYTVFTEQIVMELLQAEDPDGLVEVSLRAKKYTVVDHPILTIEYGSNTLQMGNPCPPICN
jgi:hypothetical protein